MYRPTAQPRVCSLAVRMGDEGKAVGYRNARRLCFGAECARRRAQSMDVHSILLGTLLFLLIGGAAAFWMYPFVSQEEMPRDKS
jgi:hypothetical protein